MSRIIAAWLQITGFRDSCSHSAAPRLREPGAAPDIDAVAIGIFQEGAPAELIGELHLVLRADLHEFGGRERFVGYSGDRDAFARQEVAERAVHLIGPLVDQ